MQFRMSCPIKDCDDGELTVEIQGKYRPARGFDPPEYPEVAILEATCGHMAAAWALPDFEDLALEAAAER